MKNEVISSPHFRQTMSQVLKQNTWRTIFWYLSWEGASPEQNDWPVCAGTKGRCFWHPLNALLGLKVSKMHSHSFFLVLKIAKKGQDFTPKCTVRAWFSSIFHCTVRVDLKYHFLARIYHRSTNMLPPVLETENWYKTDIEQSSETSKLLNQKWSKNERVNITLT